MAAKPTAPSGSGAAGTEDFGDRPAKLIAAFELLDSKKTGKLPTQLVMKLFNKFDVSLTAEEKREFEQEADNGGFIKYNDFVKNVVFGPIK